MWLSKQELVQGLGFDPRAKKNKPLKHLALKSSAWYPTRQPSTDVLMLVGRSWW